MLTALRLECWLGREDGSVGSAGTFIAVAGHSPATIGEVPVTELGRPKVASAQYGMLADAAGRWTEDDALRGQTMRVYSPAERRLKPVSPLRQGLQPPVANLRGRHERGRGGPMLVAEGWSHDGGG